MDEKDSFHTFDRADPSFAAFFLRDTGRKANDPASRSQASPHVGRALNGGTSRLRTSAFVEQDEQRRGFNLLQQMET